ncbi:hypothetical protein ACFRCI_30760 [Streptomyces sp. NPDC056638]|uniref:hypothetical protein n=1 Tax=Streptomyces sp. NPDC056638 TaxID=3345887 RepID=UPI0036AEF6C5
MLLDDDQRTFEQALVTRFVGHRDSVGYGSSPRMLLRVGVIAVAALAVQVHGWVVGHPFGLPSQRSARQPGGTAVTRSATSPRPAVPSRSGTLITLPGQTRPSRTWKGCIPASSSRRCHDAGASGRCLPSCTAISQLARGLFRAGAQDRSQVRAPG